MHSKFADSWDFATELGVSDCHRGLGRGVRAKQCRWRLKPAVTANRILLKWLVFTRPHLAGFARPLTPAAAAATITASLKGADVRTCNLLTAHLEYPARYYVMGGEPTGEFMNIKGATRLL